MVIWPLRPKMGDHEWPAIYDQYTLPARYWTKTGEGWALTKSCCSHCHVFCFGERNDVLYVFRGAGNTCVSWKIFDDTAPILELCISIYL